MSNIAVHVAENNEPTYSTKSSEHYSYKFSDEALRTWKSTFSANADDTKLLSATTQAIFSWSHINVFCQKPDRPSKKNTKKLPSLLNVDSKCQSKHILKNMSGSAYPGELLVIMGSSGSGKTTLLNCMTFRNLKGLQVSGMITINDEPVDQTILASQSAYVQQDDLLLGYLTVKEHLIFQAQVRLDPKLTYEEKLNRVEEVMMELSLKKCENCIIGVPGVIKGISGGERKRVALASEFLLNPSLLLCDEPTTGLDSFMSLNVMHMLKDIARSGRTVITTLHQPSSEAYLLIDKLCLVAEGRTAFLGTPEEADEFFTIQHAPCPKNFNPAEYYIQVLSVYSDKKKYCKKTIEDLCDTFHLSTTGMEIEQKADEIMISRQGSQMMWSTSERNVNIYKVGWWAQNRALIWRSWLAFIKNSAVTRARYISGIGEASLITIIYFGQILNQTAITNLDGVVFYLVVSTAYQDLYGVMNMFCGEIPLFLKEHKDGLYRTDTYFLSKSICAIPVSLAMSISKTVIIYYAVGLNPEFTRFLAALLVTILVGLTAQGVGFIISSVATSKQLAPTLTCVFVQPFIMLGGIYLNFRSIPPFLRWLSDLSLFKFGNQAYMVNQWSNIRHIPCGLNSSSLGICIHSGIQVLQKESISVHAFWPAIGSLLVLLVLFRLIAFACLLYKANRRD